MILFLFSSCLCLQSVFLCATTEASSVDVSVEMWTTLFCVSTAWLHVFCLRWQLLICAHIQEPDEGTWPTHTHRQHTPLTPTQQLSSLALTLVCYSATRLMLWDEHNKLFRVCVLVEWVKWWWIHTGVLWPISGRWGGCFLMQQALICFFSVVLFSQALN